MMPRACGRCTAYAVNSMLNQCTTPTRRAGTARARTRTRRDTALAQGPHPRGGILRNKDGRAHLRLRRTWLLCNRRARCTQPRQMYLGWAPRQVPQACHHSSILRIHQRRCNILIILVTVRSQYPPASPLDMLLAHTSSFLREGIQEGRLSYAAHRLRRRVPGLQAVSSHCQCPLQLLKSRNSSRVRQWTARTRLCL
jgi:hypothetical protein